MKATAKMFGSHPFRTITFLVVIMMTSLPTVTSRYENCETKSNGVVSYSACAAAARELVGMNFAVSVEPPNLTCGVTGPTSYCTMGLMECGTCNEANPHPPSAITDMNMTSGAVKSTWWQSVSWTMYPTPLQINITANFNKAYELVDDLKISFKSPRPRKMTILKSVDYGKTWTPMQYYSSSCDRLVQRGVATSFTSTNPDAVICTNRYSSEVPYKDADVIFPVRDRYNLFLTPGNSDRSRLYTAFETTNLTDFLQFTGIRIMLEEPNTDGKETLKRPQDLLKYFYAVSAISVTGSCSCNRHGKYCIPDPKGTNKICECMHNTEGNECERCKPLYNNRPWKRGSYLPYPTGTANECQKCECYGHADSCVYDAKLGTGVCQNCTHNTRGKNCEVCITGYRHNSSLPKTDPNACVPCICDPIGVKNNDTNCNDKGQCPCKPNVIGLKCDQCASGHYGLKLPVSNGTCLACNCVLDGTLNYNNTCDPVNGQCQCKPNINGRTCNVCKDGYYSFPSDGSGHTDCLPCNCDPGGSKSLTCEKSTGQCSCQVGLSGRTCNRALPGFYVPTVDAYNLQPLSGNCQRGTAMNHASVVMTDRYYFNCTFGKDIPIVHFQDMNGGEMTNAKLRWQYTPVLRYTLNSSAPWQSARVEIAKVSNSVVNLKRLQEINNNTIAPTCPDTAGVIGVISFSDLKPGKGKAAVAGANVTLDVRCVYSVTLTLPAPGNTSSSIVIDSIAMAPDYTESRIYKNAMNGQKAEYKTCFESTLDLESRTQTLGNNVCSQFNLAVGAETHNGANECSCDPKGSTEIQKCLALGGQCTCKPGVMGRSCDRCAPGFYNFTSAGCTPCGCDPLGSATLVCNVTTGQCPCRPNVAMAGQLNIRNDTADKQCKFCIRDYYGHRTGQGCSACKCNTTGSLISQCSDSGSCLCKDTIYGQNCDKCVVGYFGFTASGCSLCNCSTAGSVNSSCDIASGQCYCKSNVKGIKCELCNSGTFNLDAANPEGCQACFCFGHGTSCTSATGFKQHVISSDSGSQWNTTTKASLLVPSPYSVGIGSLLGQIQNVGFRIFPNEFNGNRISSYNKPLVVNISVPAGVIVDLMGHPMVILQGQDTSVGYNTAGMNLTSATKSLVLPMHHLNWKINATSAPDAFTFMKILQNLTAVLVQQTFNGVAITVSKGSLMTAIEGADDDDIQVTSVENCTCNPTTNTDGQRCELCQQGFQRQNINGSAFETCKECTCNRRTETTPPKCDMNTGVCLNCRNGTTGPQCELCAPNVQGVECDTCMDQYWGLSKTGCQACACSKTGASDNICHKVTGQCKCKRQVVGRQCDQCADNHHNLTNSGCSECDGCYKLVFDEVTKLREVQTNLTNYVTLLESMDNNTKYGPFQMRLDKLVSDMRILKDFLLRADVSESTIGLQIKSLNASLKELENNVTIDAPHDTMLANNSLVRAASLLETRNEIWTQANTTMFEVQKVADLVKVGLEILQPLVDRLKRSAKTVDALSGGTIERSRKVVEAVNEIEAASTTASAAAANALKVSSESHTKHQSTTQQIVELRTTMDAQTAGIAELQKATEAARRNVTSLQDLSSRLARDATTMPQSAFDINGMRTRAQAYLAQAKSLSSQAENGTTEELKVLGEVNQARTNATPTDQLTQNLVSSVTQLRNQAQDMYNQANLAKTQSTQVFQNASNMQNTITNYQTQALVVETKANESLKQVPDVNGKTAQIKTEAQTMINDLEVTKTSSDQTLQSLQTASEHADKLLVDMTAAKNLSDQLAAKAAPILNDIQSKMEEVILTNQTKLIPLKKKYDNLGKIITSINNKTVHTQETASKASDQVNKNRQRIEAIASTITNMRQLNATQVQNLLKEIRQLNTMYDSQNFMPIINALNQTRIANEQWVAEAEARKEKLRKAIEKSRDILTQLRVLSGP